ncbi:MAG: ABC transporter permease [Haloferacaceae archaeon]
MSWRHVFRRDLTSVYRSRTGTAVAALLGLSTVVVVGLGAVADSLAVVAVGAVLTVAVVLALVFLGSPRSIAGAIAVFAGIAVVLALVLSDTEPSGMGVDGAVALVAGILSLVVPLVALVASYGAVVGERETGSVRFLLGLPNSRDQAYAGKLCARTVAIAAPLAVALALTGVVVTLTADPGSVRFGGLVRMLGLAAVTLPYVFVFVGIGLTASVYADSSNRAVAAVIAVFGFLRVGWPALQEVVWALTRPPDLSTSPTRPAWFFWSDRLNPINAYLKTTSLLVEGEIPIIVRPSEPVVPVATSLGFAAVVLLAWAALTPVGGLLYFRTRDLT